MTYLEEKIAQFRSMAAQEILTDEEIVEFFQELIDQGYGDGEKAASIFDGLEQVFIPIIFDKESMKYCMPAGFYVHNSEPNKKMRLVSFSDKQGNFQVSKNSKAVMIIGLGAVTHVDPPADYMEWNKVFEENN